jgi:hypothetical protein
VLLGASVAELQAAKQRVDVLAAHLPGADVAFMVQEDPNLMFEELEPSKQSDAAFCLLHLVILVMRTVMVEYLAGMTGGLSVIDL